MQAMNIPVLLTFLALSGCWGHAVTLPRTSTLLKESIQLLDKLLEMEVSCDKMNMTNVFTGDKQDNAMDMLCRASTVVLQGRGCHRQLEGVHLNLLQVLQRKSTVHKRSCPVAAGPTTSLRHFLTDLHRLLQRLVKE